MTRPPTAPYPSGRGGSVIDDVQQIRELIARQFEAVSWTDGRSSDWSGFAADFVGGAPLYPSARPVRATTVPEFVSRMRGLAQGELRSLEETLLGVEVRVFGNVAVAMAACGMRENGGEAERGVEALLLVRDEGAWRIAAQAWDMERPGLEIPPDLIGS